MTARRRGAVLGACALCALLVGALGAQGASAAGTTAFTCKNEGPGHAFARAHCTPGDETGGEYELVAIEPGTQTETIGTNTTTEGGTENAIMKSTTAGITVEFTATTVHETGTMENAYDAETEEHYVHGTGEITYSNVTANHNCTVREDSGGEPGAVGVVKTKQLTATTKGQGDAVRFTGEEQENGEYLFGNFFLEGCSISALNKTWSIWGHFDGTAEGATTRSTHAEVTEQGTMHVQSEAGAKAGIAALRTTSGRMNSEEEYTALVATTTE